MAKTRIVIASGNGLGEDRPVMVNVNGKVTSIPRGVESDVAPEVFEALRHTTYVNKDGKEVRRFSMHVMGEVPDEDAAAPVKTGGKSGKKGEASGVGADGGQEAQGATDAAA